MPLIHVFANLCKIALSCLVPASVLYFGPTTPWTLLAFAVSIGVPMYVILDSGLFGEFSGEPAPVYVSQYDSEDGSVATHESLSHGDDFSRHSYSVDDTDNSFSLGGNIFETDSFTPSVNVDGTPMIGETGIDTNGHSYGSTS